jgi:ATP-binding protein involved in chromosome partitioning
MIETETLLSLLDGVPDPLNGTGIVAAGRVLGPKIEVKRISFVLDVSGLRPDQRDALDKAVHQVLEQTEAFDEIRVAMTSEKRTRKIIAVASGKGGVGKSTVSVNLAIALARAGVRAGLADADIYGPSVPKLTATEGQKPEAVEKQLIAIPTELGIRVLSMGHLVREGQAVAWRGPMAGNALSQLLEADWGDAEVLVVDMPPGTGDVQLSMVQKHAPAGAIIVSTPQDLALIDAMRAIDLFNTTKVPIIGLVENMSGYACPECGAVSDPFGKGGAEKTAEKLGVSFLGRIPLAMEIRTSSDAGLPVANQSDDIAKPFLEIAEKIATWVRNSG